VKIRDLTDPVEPITLQECREHLNLVGDVGSSGESHPDDDQISAFLSAAREYTEKWTGYIIARRQVEVAFDDFGDEDWLDLISPVVELIAVDYIVSGQTLSTEDSDEQIGVTLDDMAVPARLVLTSGSWPATDEVPNAIRVRLEAGFKGPDAVSTDDAQLLPKSLRAAILLLMAHLYENREASIEKALSEIPFGVECLLRLYRFKLGMA
jgi:uncharacterized phiE125 gp8 family phage protein